MKIGANRITAASVLLLVAALFAMAGIVGHGCGVTEFGEISLKSIKVTPANKEVYSGATVTFTATGIYSDTTEKDLTSQVTWESSGDEVAINAATGLATAGEVSENYTCTITASLDGTRGTATLTVKVPAFVSLSISAQGGTSIAQQTSVQFTATGNLEDGSTQDLTSKVAWSSSAPSVVEIDAAGKATGISGGTAQITATYGDLTSNSVDVAVSSASLTSLDIQVADGGSATIKQTKTVQFSATGAFSNGNTQDMTSSVTWSSSNTSVATISASGLVTAVATSGTTAISATFIGITSNEVTVTALGAALVSISVTSTISGGLSQNTTRSLTATATYSNDSTGTVTQAVVWSSSDTSIATVDANGVVTGVAAGQATISASQDGVMATMDITVTGGY